jgi:hypothetical protein
MRSSAAWLEPGDDCHCRHWLGLATLRTLKRSNSPETRRMETDVPRAFTLLDGAMATLVAVVFVFLVSLLKEPTRQRFMAIFVAGAGSAYLNGGLGGWEFLFTAVATYVAYRGLDSYRFIGIAWLMHTAWDVAHHFFGHPIIYFAPMSSAQCALTDALIALWFFAGAPSVIDALRARRRRLATAVR